MGKLKFKSIDPNTVQVYIPADTPLEMVEQLSKSLSEKGLVEDVGRSTLSTRYFYRTRDAASHVADKVISSLRSIQGKEHGRTTATTNMRKVDMPATSTTDDTKLFKSWINNLPIPNAEKEITNIARTAVKTNQVDDYENNAAVQLAHMMASKNMLNGYIYHPINTTPNPNYVAQQAAAQEQRWNNVLNDWIHEAMKPINSRFSSEEEELAYWNSIKIQDSSKDDYGY